MIFKKFIGALTALVMTMTAFVGLATEVGAVTTENTSGYVLDLTLDGVDISDTVYADDLDEFNAFLTDANHIFTYGDRTYVVTDCSISGFTPPTIEVTAVSASTLTINISGNGHVEIAGDNFESGDTYTAAVGATPTISFFAGTNSYIEHIECTGITPPSDTSLTYWRTDYTMPKGSATLNVTFGTTYSISTDPSENGSIEVVQESAKENDLITVLASPIDGYELTGIIFESLSPELTPEVAIVDNRATFAMPASNITITPIFSKIETLPSDVTAACIGDYTDPNAGPYASLWEGTLRGQGDTSYKPSVTVTAKDASVGSRTLISETTVTDGGNIYLAIVVDLRKDDIEEVRLSGVTATTEAGIPKGSLYHDYSSDETGTEAEEVE